MRILHILTRFLRAGTEENTLALCHEQQADGHDVILAVGRESDASYLQQVRPRFPVHQIDALVHRISPANDLLALFAIRRLVRRLQPDLVHTHQSKAGILGRMAVGSRGREVIVHGVHILPWSGVGRLRDAIYTRAERWTSTFTDAFLDVSPAVRDECLSRGIGAPEKHFVIPSPIDLARFRGAPWPSDWTELVGASRREVKPPVLLMLAAFEPRKRQRAFVEALAGADLPSDAVVLFAGEGPSLEDARRAATAVGLSGRVRFLGHRGDAERLIALADVCVLTSEREGLPRVLVQYLAGGRASVVTELPSLKDVVVDRRNAVIVNSVAAAASEASALLRDATRRQTLAVGAAQTDLSAWDIARVYPACQQAYRAADQFRAHRLGLAPLPAS